ncbi:hypothetical protein CDAR_286662 [Caerostris darwini]|uniref:Uncharacterized protein n=1 Tax=Caerostris darwini TaxID=1538125 RepID=A0AAV4UUE8_9ARAC|nr:hypothetical protein CDAR_286662 [Caerostris darwini]
MFTDKTAVVAFEKIEKVQIEVRRHLAHGGDPGHRGFAPLPRHARAEHQERQGFPAGVLRGQPAVVQGGGSSLLAHTGDQRFPGARGDGGQQVRPGHPSPGSPGDGGAAGGRHHGGVRVLRGLSQVRHQRQGRVPAATADGQDPGGGAGGAAGGAGPVQEEEHEALQETQPQALLLQQHGLRPQEEPTFPGTSPTYPGHDGQAARLLQESQGQSEVRADLRLTVVEIYLLSFVRAVLQK